MTCETGKICYDTHSEAIGKCEAIKHRPGARRVIAYRCQFCGGWHLATKRKPTPAQIEARNARRLDRMGAFDAAE
jgi:hypothetical protein